MLQIKVANNTPLPIKREMHFTHIYMPATWLHTYMHMAHASK